MHVCACVCVRARVCLTCFGNGFYQRIKKNVVSSVEHTFYLGFCQIVKFTDDIAF